MKIQDVLDELHIPYLTGNHDHAREGWVQIDCPHCTPNSNHWRLGINETFHYANCWSCGPQSFGKALIAYGNSPKRVWGLLDNMDRATATQEKRKGVLKFPMGIEKLQLPHRYYLKSRGLDCKEMENLWQLQAIGQMGGLLRWRLFIPVVENGDTVSWTTRSINDDPGDIRWLSAKADQEKAPIRDLVYGIDYVRNVAIIVEGPSDVWKVGPGAVATFGLAYRQPQLVRLSQIPIRYVCYDNHPDAQKRAKELCDSLKVFPGNTYNICLDAEDPGSASDRELRKLRSLL